MTHWLPLTRLKPLIKLGLIALLTAVLAIGCGSGGPTDPSQLGQTPCQPIQHAAGETCVPSDIQRVVTLGTPTLANALVLETKPVGGIFYFDKAPAYLNGKNEGIERVGTGEQPNLEKILALQPDLIIAMNEWSITHEKLSQIAPTIVDNWQGYQSWKTHFNFVAEALGKTSEAEQIWSSYEQRVQELKSALGDIYKGKTVSFIYLCCGGISVDVSNSFIGTILSDVGLERPPAQAVETDSGVIILSKERLMDMDGDIIFLAVDEDQDSRMMLKQLQQNPLWQQLNAVKNGQVYPVNLATWRGGNPLAAEAVIDDLFKYLVNSEV
jgi:iron complex transport system substrate-binding protein